MIQNKQSSGNLVADKRAEYARHYARTKDYEAASDLMKQALELAPQWASGWYALGEYLEKTDNIEPARHAYEQALGMSTTDYLGAGLKIAILTKVPFDGEPLAYTEALFDGYADRFDASLVDGLSYCAPQRHAAQLMATAGTKRFAKALDLGCGTGLMAAQVRNRIDHLTGIDLSSAMLAKAKQKGLYDHLVKSDVSSALLQFEDVDLVMAADVFIYTANLEPVFALISAALANGGLFLFSAEQHTGNEPWKLRESMRHAHSEKYIETLLSRNNFATLILEHAPIRTDRGEPVAGLYYVAQKQADAAPDAA